MAQELCSTSLLTFAVKKIIYLFNKRVGFDQLMLLF